MPRQKSIPFDVTAMLNEPVEADPLPIADRFIDTPLRPYANPNYLARHLCEAVEFEVQGSSTPGYKFVCPACGGSAQATYGHPAEGPFNLICEGSCSPEKLRKELQQLAPLAFELRDDLLFAIPSHLRDLIIAAGLDGDPVPDHPDVAAVLRSMRRKGGSISVADYTGPDGQSVLLIFRVDFEGGGKRFWPVHCWVDASDQVQVECAFPHGLLPLFNWTSFAHDPDAPVLVVEGEKTAKAASALLPDFLAITSPCGAYNTSLADWGLVSGRDVVIWRDNDEAGSRHEQGAAANAIMAGARSVRKVILPPGLPPGWDLGDTLPEGVTIEHVRSALIAAVEVHWDDVKHALTRSSDETKYPPLRLPDGLFTHKKVVQEALAGALEQLDSGCTRSRWFVVLSGIHHALGESGFELADEWSSRYAEQHGKYHEGEVRRIFESFERAPLGNPTPLLWVLRMAMKAARDKDPDSPWEPASAALAWAYIADFESCHRKITQGDNITIGIQKYLANGSYEIREMKEKNAESLYLSKKAPDFEGNSTSIFKLWQHHQLVDPVELVFKPNGDVGSNELNLFRGFNVQPVASNGSCALFKEHIDHVAKTNGDEKGYLWNLLAYRLQNPGTFVPCALVLIGPEGGGKTTITGAMAKLTAPYSLTLSDPEKFVGRNNACLTGKLFVQLEEMILGRNEHYDSRLKHYVTSETLDVEEKWKAQWAIPNHLFIAMTANKKSVIRITEHSRRFAVYEVSDRFRGDREARETFFGKLWAELEGGGLEALAHELMLVDLDGFTPTAVPKTPLFLELAGVDADSDPLRAWWHEVLERGDLEGDSRNDADWAAPCRKEALYQQYAGWCRDNGTKAMRTVLSKAEWAKGLGRMLPKGLPAKRMSRDGKRDHYLELPPYEDCCSFFEDRFDCKLDRAPEAIQLKAVM